MKTKYTPGPCFISASVEIGYERAWQVSAPIGAATQHVATFKRKPDADLFCAAPELLEALERVYEAMRHYPEFARYTDDSGVTYSPEAIARVAINKAKGGQQ